MSILMRRVILALVVAASASVPLELAEARGIKVRSSGGSSSAPAEAPAEATADTEPRVKVNVSAEERRKQEELRNVYMMRAERALEEERLGDPVAVPMLVKPTGDGATIVTAPSTEKLQCIAGC